MVENQYHDKPIKSIDDSLFESHTIFAEQTAKMFLNWKSDSSLVTALYGEWGSGKTSISNMIVEKLETANQHIQCENEKAIIIRYNPWEFASQDTIIQSFYTSASDQLDKKGADAKKLAELLMKVQKGAQKTHSLIEIIKSKTASILSIGSIFLGLIGLSLYQEIVSKWVVLAFIVLGGAPIFIDKFLEVYFDFFPHRQKKPQELKKEIENLLHQRKAPLLIILDDVDRLSPHQLKTVIQLVKVNTDFPNTIFFLLYQKDIVERMLTERGVIGSEYMKKIIQIPLSTPYEVRDEIREYLLSNLPVKISSGSEARFYDALDNIIFMEIKTLRDAKRFIISLSFYKAFYENNEGLLEIDLVDFIVMEFLKVFKPALYVLIADNWRFLHFELWKTDLQKSKTSSFTKKYDKNNALEKLDSFGKEKEIAIQILDFLFNRNQRIPSGIYRINNEIIYKKYFSLQRAGKDILLESDFFNITLDELLDKHDMFVKLDRGNEFFRFIEEVSYSLAPDVLKIYITFILRILDYTQGEKESSLDNIYRYAYLFRELLEKFDISERNCFLFKELDLLDDQYSIFLLAFMCAEGNAGKPILNEEGSKRLDQIFLQKVEILSEKFSDKLYRNAQALMILYNWRHKTKDQGIITNNLIRFLRAEHKNCLVLLDIFLGYYHSSATGYNYYIDQSRIQEFLPTHELEKLILELNKNELSKREVWLIDLFYKNEKAPF